jgi:hypothetical protein
MFGVCMRLFCVCVVLCLGRGFSTSWSPVQGVLSSVKWSRNSEISPMLQSGSKKVEKKYIHTVRDYRQCSAIAILHTLQFTIAHALGFSVFTSRILATDLSVSL